MLSSRLIRSVNYSALVFVLLLLQTFASDLQACRQDYDCTAGAVCIKSERSQYGICLGGDSPGRSNDDYLDPDPMDQSLGTTCNENLNCVRGKVCFKTGDSELGACIPQGWLKRKDIKNLSEKRK